MAERNIRTLLGDDPGRSEKGAPVATPVGDQGPVVARPIDSRWLIGRVGRVGRLGGEHSIVAQVDRIVAEGQESPTMRLTQDVTATPLELDMLKEAVGGFVEAAKGLGVTLSGGEASLIGPARVSHSRKPYPGTVSSG